ncbi:MAG: hypothetical protein ACMV0Y_10685 [Paludibacter sp.]
MAAPKGHTINTGVSRRKNIPNKITKQTKDLLATFVNQNMVQAQEMFNQIENPAEKLKILVTMLKYVVPTLNSVTINDDAGNNVVRQILEAQSK